MWFRACSKKGMIINMIIKNCKRCNEVFNFVSSPYCQNCLETIEKSYKTVRNYVYKHPDATVEIISEEVGIEQDLVLEMLREGKLEWKPKADAVCEICGHPASFGKVCQSCSNRLRSTPSAEQAPRSNEKKKSAAIGKITGMMHTNVGKE